MVISVSAEQQSKLDQDYETAREITVDCARAVHRKLSGGRGSIIEHRQMIKALQQWPELYKDLERLLTSIDRLETAEFYQRHPQYVKPTK